MGEDEFTVERGGGYLGVWVEGDGCWTKGGVSEVDRDIGFGSDGS